MQTLDSNEIPNTEAVDLAEKVVNDDAKEKEQKRLQGISEQIKKVLEDNNMALQPMLNVSQFGIIPMVNLVDMPKKDEEVKDAPAGVDKPVVEDKPVK